MQFRVRNAAIAAALAAALAIVAGTALAADTKAPDAHARGRYIVMIGGCNDCHTPGFAMTGGKVDEKQWLIGDSLGWRGPWGTTYPVNLRLYVQALNENAWVDKARHSDRTPADAVLGAEQDVGHRLARCLSLHSRARPGRRACAGVRAAQSGAQASVRDVSRRAAELSIVRCASSNRSRCAADTRRSSRSAPSISTASARPPPTASYGVCGTRPFRRRT